MGTFIGIDLGTTYSVVAYINPDGKAEVIYNDQHRVLTPSVVDLTSDPPLVGDEAKEKQAFGDEGVYSLFKRDIGEPNILYLENGKEYTPINLSAIVLNYLKSCATKFLSQPVTDAVITVPAYFNNKQRQATIEAAQEAGLRVLRIISEPTAAALAYGVRPTNSKSTILVYDLGGGTFDISLVEITPEQLRVIGTAGDHKLGGKDWDDRILLYLSQEFEKEFGVELIGEDFNELMIIAEQTKISLSTKKSVKVRVQNNECRGRYDISRSQFQNLTTDLMKRTQLLVNQVLEDAQMIWTDLDGVVLVGGSTRMPMVKEYVTQISGKPPLSGVNPDEAVALGAAIQAAMDRETSEQKVMFLGGRKKNIDVISRSLGMIALNEDNSKYINSIIIQKNEPIPCQQTRPYRLPIRPTEDNRLEVFMTQGETEEPNSCAYLGQYVFTNIPKIQGRAAIIDLTYSYNLNGVVEVSAVERSTQQPLTLSIEPLPHDVPDRFTLPPAIETVREHLNLYMAFDLSGSMEGKPLSEARRAANNFVSQCDLTTTSIGIIEFSNRTLTTVQECQNTKKIARGIRNLKIGRTGYGNETHPFDEILRLLENTNGLRYGLILTDGVWSNPRRAIRSAQYCHQAGIEIIAVGFGRADKNFLSKISSSDELSFFTDLNELNKTLSYIAQELTETRSSLKAIRP